MSSPARNVVLGIVLLAAVGAGAWYVSTNGRKGASLNPETKISETQTSTVDESWKTFRNEHLGFEAKYPANWGITNVVEESTGTAQVLDKGFAYFGMLNQEYMDPNLMNLSIAVSESNLDLKEYEKVKYGEKVPDADGESVEDLKKFADSLDIRQAGNDPEGRWNFCPSVLLKEKAGFFKIDACIFADSEASMKQRIEEYRNFLKTFTIL